MQEFRTDLSRTTSPLRLAALRAAACAGGALLLSAPFMGWLPGLFVLLGLAGSYALAAGWDERLGGTADRPLSDGSETNRRGLRLGSVSRLKS